ncbi:hypothetical protein [Pelosinus baikalensis]|uniref:Uncharacterized protein n=1 Tax=Pelosinus baikalensis TaxID=2892015 RepID=A0ABS8HUQ7_9FIRM|nr:hypothetical protein [Pelosinus baikalensis]MCC5466895.1 hypothetical protein [Pelosinus baikalensis]
MSKQCMNYIEKAVELQKQANKVIEDLQIKGRWELVGNTILVGSANFGLMTTPNLDFEIYVKEPDVRIGFDTVRELAVIPGVKQIQFLNFMETSDPGFYWRIDYQDQQGIMWDIDNWLVPFSHPHAGMAERFAKAMKQALTDETRQIILEIKSQMTLENKCRGIDVYKAVLSGGVRDREQFIKWIAEYPPIEMETCQPSI